MGISENVICCLWLDWYFTKRAIIFHFSSNDTSLKNLNGNIIFRDENRKFFLLITITTWTILNVVQKSVKAWIAVNKISVLPDQKFCSYQFALELQACAGLQFLKEDVVVKKKTCKFWYMTLFEQVAFHKQNLLSTNCCMLL